MKIYDDLKWIGISVVMMVVLLKVVFYKESLFVISRLIIGIYWIYVLPGMAILYAWREKFDLIELGIMGAIFGFSIMSMINYYVGKWGLHIKWQVLFFPLIFFGAGIALMRLVAQKNESLKSEGKTVDQKDKPKEDKNQDR